MNFDFNEEQIALQDSLARLLSDKHSHEKRREIAATTDGYSQYLWRQLSELGITALPVSEDAGGLGGTGIEVMLVMKELGRSLLASPLLRSCVMPARALAGVAEEAIRQQWLPALAAGDVQVAWAHDEADGDGGPAWVSTKATIERGRGWTLDGCKVNVHHSASADYFLVTAREAGSDADIEGRALFLVPADAKGLTVRNYRLIDGTPAGELVFKSVQATALHGNLGNLASDVIGATLAMGISSTCAELVGIMEAAQTLTVEYVNTRKQFGRAIGQNQALRHKVADMQVSLELARSITIGAAIAVDRLADEQSWADLHRAKIVVGRHARMLCQMAIQLHGGIGVTQEYAVGHYLRRAHVLDQMFGDSDMHTKCLAEIL